MANGHGLDEVFEPGKREDVIKEIHRFTNKYPKVRVIVTSRVIGYKPQRLRDAEFRHVMLQDLESEQIQTFIQQWHELTFTDTDQADKVRKRERLQKAIETSSPIRQLAQNPLLLTMMAILNRNQELPRDRSELYNQSSRLLLHQWDVERALLEDNRVDPKTIDYKDKQQILAKLADFMQGNQAGLAGNLISGEDLERIIKEELKLRDVNDPRAVAKVMINQLRTRNFILCFMGADYYAFVHRTFLEYFCAWEFVRKFEKTQEISLEQLQTEVFGKHWRDEYWHEVLRLITGMIDSKKAGEVIEYLIAQDGEEDKFVNLFLAADCLSEVRNRYEIKLTDSELLNRVKDLIHYDLNYDYEKYGNEAILVYNIITQALVAVATHWQDHRDTLPLLQQWARSDKKLRVRRTAILLLAQSYKDHPDNLPLFQELARSDKNSLLRRIAIEQLAQGYKDHQDTLPLLKESARSDTDSWVRREAIQQLAVGYKDHQDTLPLLQQSARSDKDSWVRREAIEQLAQGYQDHQDTLPLLQESARSDKNSRVRGTAIEQLAQGYQDHRDTLLLLQESARCDTDSDVRREAIEQLAQGYQDHQDTLPLLQESARSDKDSRVRRRAIEQLAKGYKDHPDTLALLQQSAHSDKDSFVRSEAIEQLAKGYKDHPDTLALLQQSARSDTDSLVRGTAIRQLAQSYKDHRDTLALLQQSARSDTDSRVRGTAIEQLAQVYKHHQDTLPLLKEWARSDIDSMVRGTAIEQLAQGWHDQPWLWEFLCDRVAWPTANRVAALSEHRTLNDTFERKEDWETNPRQVALKAILEYYPNHAQNRSLLQNRAEHDPDPKLRQFAKEQLE
ncbi:HEAT repeat domain-containing protein [Moorena sp. SIO3F7]|uniref:HEAT repeat domain-containing protein n=1 Tax=unclassified Moorena TaxID=2683338 RepID=UPI00344D2C41